MEFTVKVRGVQTLEYKFHVHAQFNNANTPVMAEKWRYQRSL